MSIWTMGFNGAGNAVNIYRDGQFAGRCPTPEIAAELVTAANSTSQEMANLKSLILSMQKTRQEAWDALDRIQEVVAGTRWEKTEEPVR